MSVQHRFAGEEDTRLPVGLLRAMAQDMHSFEVYAGLSDSERRELRRRAENCRDPREMEMLVKSIKDF